MFPQQHGIVNDPTTCLVQLTDTTTDTALPASGYGILYTNGGVKPSDTLFGPPVAFVHASRMWAVDPIDTKTLRYSKLFVSGEAPGFPQAFFLRLDDCPDGITGLGQLDDKLIIFTPTRIYYVSGDGPNDTGLQGGFAVVRIMADAGTTDARSVLSYPDGLFYLGPGGLNKLSRSLEVLEVGEVRGIMGAVTSSVGLGHTQPVVLSAELDAVRDRCRFVTSRTDLTTPPVARTIHTVYDHSLNIWTTEEPYAPAHAAAGTFRILASQGTLTTSALDYLIWTIGPGPSGGH